MDPYVAASLGWTIVTICVSVWAWNAARAQRFTLTSTAATSGPPLRAIQPSLAVVNVLVGAMTAAGTAFLWLILAVGLLMDDRDPTESYPGVPFLVFGVMIVVGIGAWLGSAVASLASFRRGDQRGMIRQMLLWPLVQLALLVLGVPIMSATWS